MSRCKHGRTAYQRTMALETCKASLLRLLKKLTIQPLLLRVKVMFISERDCTWTGL